MHVLWNGSINFGLVNIPIKLYNGSTSPGLNLTMLHKKDKSPIRYARICRAEDKEIPYSEITKGYEIEKNEYVLLNEQDFEKATVTPTHSIDIIEFIDQKEIDIRYYDKPYYLEPTKTSAKAYILLREVLAQSKKIAVATYVLHNRGHLGVLKPVGKVLILNRIRYARELRDFKEIDIPEKIDLKHQEIQMAATLVKQLTRKFTPNTLHDTYDEELEKIVEAKAKGAQIRTKKAEPRRSKAKNLMAALTASLKKTGSKSKPRARRANQSR
ncbi:MAG: Ku protein [Proteobacteria bacterium]|nr:Ku protein [Pseudomonadota bacterium]